MWREQRSDHVVQLREWGTEHVHALSVARPRAWLHELEEEDPEWPEESGALDGHAQLAWDGRAWRLRDAGIPHGLRRDGVPCAEIELAAGLELGIGRTTLIVETAPWLALRDYVQRVLGWAPAQAPRVDAALRAIRLAATVGTPLLLCGDDDLVPIAHAIHCRGIGAERPFVVCDPRRRDAPASARVPANHHDIAAACELARTGTLCIRAARPPRELALVLAREPAARIQIAVCATRAEAGRLAAFGAQPIEVPALATRSDELPRIIAAYASDELGGAERGSAAGWQRGVVDERGGAALGPDDLAWIRARASGSLDEIAKATQRLVALRRAPTVAAAAARLGMSTASLWNWMARRELPAVVALGAGAA